MLYSYSRDRLRTLTEIYAAFGLKKTLQKVFTALKKRIYRRQIDIFLEKDLNEELTFSFERKLSAIKTMEEMHIPAMVALCERTHSKKYPLKVFKDYVHNRSRCFILEQDSKLIGYVWWVDKTWGTEFKTLDFKFYRREIHLTDGDVYLFDALLDPEYRGRDNSLEFFLHVFSTLKEQGYQRAFGFVRAHNTPARWLYKLIGYKDVKRIVERRFFRIFVMKGNRFLLDM